jgi:hypothetical protein
VHWELGEPERGIDGRRTPPSTWARWVTVASPSHHRLGSPCDQQRTGVEHSARALEQVLHSSYSSEAMQAGDACRRGSTLLVVIAGLIAACGSSTDDGGDVETFRSPVYGYSLERDENWTVIEATRRLEDGEPPATASGATDILGRGASVRVSEMAPPGVIIGGQPVPSGTSADEWGSMVVGTVSFMKGCPRPDARENIRVDGVEAVLLTYEACPLESGFLHYWVAVRHDGVGFHVVWFDEPGRADADRPALDALLSTISFDG